MSTENIKVEFNNQTNSIIIKKNDVNSTTSAITGIKSIFNEMDTVNNYDEMMKQQQVLNYLDSIKDGANVAVIQQLNMYPLAYVDGNSPRYPDDLHKYETNIFNANKENMTRITWTKLNKRDELNEKLDITNVFRDCGISADVFIKNFQLINTIASYIDPATRAEPNSVWPSNSIEFTTEFMRLFGFENSSLKSRTVNKLRFNYEIMTNGIMFTNDGKTPDVNLNYFSGNTNKNKILKSSTSSTNQKKALISLKEWGDKMQVLILYVWSRLNKETYTMITCDKVVYLLCLLLKVKCIFTGEIIEDKQKKYSIEIFEPSANPKKDAVNRYNRKKRSIINENKEFIKMIELLVNNPSQRIYIDAYETPFTFAKKFYQNIYTDISVIQQNLNNIPILTYSTPLNESDIEKASKKLGEDYLLINFIKKIGDKIKIIRSTKYTNTNKFKPSFDRSTKSDNSKKSFYDMAVSNYKINGNIKKGGGIGRDENKNMAYKGSRQAIKFSPKSNQSMSSFPKQEAIYSDNIPAVINSIEFNGSDYYTDKIMFDYYEDVPVEKEDNPNDQLINFIRQEKSIDLNKILYDQVVKIVSANNYSQFMDSIYSMVLYYAYYNDGIPLDYTENENRKSDLEMVVEQIVQEDLDLSYITIEDSLAMEIDDNLSGITMASTQSYPTTTTSSQSNSFANFLNFWQTPSTISVMGGAKNKTKRSNHRHKKTKQKKTTTRKKKVKKIGKKINM